MNEGSTLYMYAANVEVVGVEVTVGPSGAEAVAGAPESPRRSVCPPDARKPS